MELSTNIAADVSVIERELQRQWRDQASGESVVRTRTLNLLIVSRTDSVPSEVTAELTEVHPCRAILVDLSSSVARFGAQVSSSHSSTHTGAKCLAREEVRLRIPAEVESKKLESVVVPLLVPGLPTFLWWRGAPDVDSPLFARLASHSDRVVVDSAESPDPWLVLAELARAVSDRSRPAAITDLAWSRITAWRELTAQFFDNRHCVGYSSCIRAARIKDGAAKHISSDAVLFGAWIARQLAWRPSGIPVSKQDEYRIPLQRENHACEIQLIQRQGAKGSLQSVQLVAAGDKDATFYIEPTTESDGLITTTRLGTQPQVQRTVRSPRLNLVEMLGCELSSIGRDALYERVLSMVAEMWGAAK